MVSIKKLMLTYCGLVLGAFSPFWFIFIIITADSLGPSSARPFEGKSVDNIWVSCIYICMYVYVFIHIYMQDWLLKGLKSENIYSYIYSSHIHSRNCISINQPSLLLLTHGDRVMCICISDLSLLQIMACHLVGAKPLSEPMLKKLLMGLLGINFSEILIKINTFSFRKKHLKYHLRNGRHFVSASMCYGRIR